MPVFAYYPLDGRVVGIGVVKLDALRSQFFHKFDNDPFVRGVVIPVVQFLRIVS
jgi:hypothetical protein